MKDPEYVYAALLDILGYRAFLRRDEEKGAVEFRHTMESALSKLDDVGKDYSVQAISDTVIITRAEHNTGHEFIELVRKTIVAFLKEGVLVRGGITYNNHYKNGNVTYSPALTRAYEIENKEAIYPRVVVDENVLRMLERDDGTIPELSGKICRQNGVHWINILHGEDAQEIWDAAKKVYLESRDTLYRQESAHMKHWWLQEYLWSVANGEGEKLERYVSSPVVIE
ncbi:hypothetical protein Mal64_25790 [Pseudobythopirellula maris]|uniref:Guanylate cyclase domain-containing protein n=1 Tax=Pseudobythopirellula maris TaxID=2527991 RepID=A0A5C5ZQ79_9BACT|nr:hypothetical protein [Pseudobythopirellula maris]TWT89087.1 hypothetical protein Mal64_25790 [Pseudobythopirellula maris]